MRILDAERLRHVAVDDIVPIMEHPDCSSNLGTIMKIDNQNNIQVRCIVCQSKGVFIDRTVLRTVRH